MQSISARNWNGGIEAGLSLNFGTQLQSVNLEIGGVLAGYASDFVSKNGNSIVITGLINYEFYNKKFGVFNRASGFGYSLKSLFGWKNALNLQSSIISNSNNNYWLDSNFEGGFNGFGIGLNGNQQFGKLKKFSNQQGNMLGYVSNKNFNLHFNFSNDFKSGFFRGKGCDKGETGSFIVKIAQIREPFIDVFGGGILLFTPEPDYSVNPTSSKNSDNDSKIVLPGTKPYEKLFHGNFYAFYSRTSPDFSAQIDLGVDSKKVGASLQNLLHDSFGLYPRFEWPVEEKNKMLVQIKGGTNFRTNNE